MRLATDKYVLKTLRKQLQLTAGWRSRGANIQHISGDIHFIYRQDKTEHVSVNMRLSIVRQPPASLSASARVLRPAPAHVVLHLYVCTVQDVSAYEEETSAVCSFASVRVSPLQFVRICIFCSLEEKVPSCVDVAKRLQAFPYVLHIFYFFFSMSIISFQMSLLHPPAPQIYHVFALFPPNFLSFGTFFPEGLSLWMRNCPTLCRLSCFRSLCPILRKSNQPICSKAANARDSSCLTWRGTVVQLDKTQMETIQCFSDEGETYFSPD